MKKYEILDADQRMEFNTIYEAINECFGKDYGGWQRACYPKFNPENGIRAWFPKLAPKVNGEYAPAALGCVNRISDDWNTFTYDDNDKRDNNGEGYYTGYDLIFAKDVGGKYVFRGVYKLDMDETRPDHYVSKRIAKKVELIGNPVYSLKLL